jgi:hypothetical protein
MKWPVVCVTIGLAAVSLAGCGRSPGDRLPDDALDQAIGRSIGDPTTCVIIADRQSGKTLYRYGQQFNCERGLPACDRPGSTTAKAALAFSATGRTASCASNGDGSRSVGWAAGKVESSKHDLVYSAVMEGDRALPGEEMSARLAQAFQNAGL